MVCVSGDRLPYDAVLVVSFGGPEKDEDVLPFLENVVRGRNVPRERLREVAGHYYHLGGRSPINDQMRALVEAVRAELESSAARVPVYWGNRNWRPLLAETLRGMAADGVRSAVAFIASAWSSYSSCRQYQEDIARAREEVGPTAPRVDKTRVFYNHPGFIEAMADRVRAARDVLAREGAGDVELIFTAHSIPLAMARSCRYASQLEQAGRLVAEAVGLDRWRLAYQSRSGPPEQPWLGPDVRDCLRELDRRPATRDVILAPLGFLSDHIEVVYDLDTQAAAVAREHGLNMVRAATVGTHPRFVAMIRDLIEERMGIQDSPRALGPDGAAEPTCAADCCPAPDRPAVAPGAGKPV